MSKKDYIYEKFSTTVTFTIEGVGRGDTHEERQKEAEEFAKDWVKRAFAAAKVKNIRIKSETTKRAK